MEQGEGGGVVGKHGAWCALRTAGLLGWSFWGIGTYCANILVLHTALPLIPHHDFFEHKCYENPPRHLVFVSLQ